MDIMIDTMLSFIDGGYWVRKISPNKFLIRKRIPNCDKEITIECVDENTCMMYNKFVRKFNSLPIRVGDYPQIDLAYKRQCEYDYKKTLLNENLMLQQPSLSLYIRHRDKNISPSYVTKMSDMKNLFDFATTKIWKLIHKYSKDRESFLRDPKVPNIVKHVAITCDGDHDKFVYGEWNCTSHYLHRLCDETLAYLAKGYGDDL